MYRIACFTAVCVFAAGAVMADAPSMSDEASIEKTFATSLQPNDLRDWMNEYHQVARTGETVIYQRSPEHN